MIKKYWKDPVWSKVIASVIFVALASIYTTIKSLLQNISFYDAFVSIIEIKVAVVYVIFALLVYLLIKSIIKKIFKNENDLSKLRFEELKKYNKNLDKKTGILLKWVVNFDNINPFISELTAFCTKHGEAPIRFDRNCCPIINCENSKQPIDIHALSNFIESNLIHRWEKINKSS